jgi:hypothetical protein
MRRAARAAILVITCVSLVGAGEVPAKHVTVYKEKGRFGGWPANHGIWVWGNEILVGFSAAYFMLKTPDRHQYDNTKPEEPRLARSLDGGETWTVEAPPSLLPPEQGGQPVRDLDQPMNFADPNFAMTLRLTNVDKGATRLWYTMDRGKTWKGPFKFPMLGLPGILGRTDYIVNGNRDAMVFLTASKTNGREGRVFCARTTDGGMNWKFISWIGEEPAGFSIMPSGIRVSPRKLLVATRDKGDQATSWIDLYESNDDGASWKKLNRPVPQAGSFSGNPPSMIRLRDGRICLTYGMRNPPYSIRARISNDEGKTWGKEIMLRDDGAAWDMGYPRTVQRADGKVVTIYYFPAQPHQERSIEATTWDPPKK